MRVFFSALFVLFLLLPPLAESLDLHSGSAAVKAAPAAPRWQTRALNDPEYYAAWQHYLKRWATRLPLLVTAKRWMDYQVFAMTDVEGIHVGRDGWLYDSASVASYRKNGCDRKPYVRRLITELQTVSDLARTSGRKLVVSVVPDKSTIYPEFMDGMPRDTDCGQSLYDIWAAEQTHSPLDCYVSLESPMQAAKKKGALLYSKTGASWTPAGAEFAARLILDAIFTNGATPPEDDLASRLFANAPDGDTQKERTENRKHLSSVLVYGSADAGRLLPYLAHGFDRVDLIVSDTLPSHDQHEDIADYEAVVLMLPESGLADVRIDMDRWCAMLSADTLAGAENSIPLVTIQARQQISIDTGAGDLAIKSLGPRSFFELPALPGSQRHTLRILKLEMEATHADQLTWMDNSEPPVSGSRAVKPGDRRHYIPLPRRPSVRLKINPGRQTGIFRLSRAAILEFDLANGILAPGTRPQEALSDQADSRPSTESVPRQPHQAAIEAPETAPQAQSSPAVALHDFQEGRVFQRTGQAADIVVSGTYSGPVEIVEARVVRAGSDDAIVPWTVIDASPKDGIFMGILPEVPQGGWYAVAVRAGNHPEISDQGKARWGVGMLVACIGQSNMEEWFHNGSDLKPHSLAGVHRNGRWQTEALTGNGAVSFANRLIGKLGIPVGILDYAVNGSGLRKEADWGTGYWADQSEKGIYRRFVRGVADAGGALEYVIWMQGEADAARGTITEKQYRATLAAFVNQQVRTDIVNASGLPHLPFLILGMPRRPIGKDGPHQAVRVAQRAVTEEVPNCYQAAVTMDLKNMGRQHLAPEAYTTLGLRAAQTVLFLLGEAPYYRGPSVAGAQKVDDHRIDIRLLHRGGNDFTPEVAITGWQVIGSSGRLHLAEVLRMDSQTIRIRLADPVHGPVKLRYLYGARPDADRPVRDNSAMELPLEPYDEVVR